LHNSISFYIVGPVVFQPKWAQFLKPFSKLW